MNLTTRARLEKEIAEVRKRTEASTLRLTALEERLRRLEQENAKLEDMYNAARGRGCFTWRAMPDHKTLDFESPEVIATLLHEVFVGFPRNITLSCPDDTGEYLIRCEQKRYTGSLAYVLLSVIQS